MKKTIIALATLGFIASAQAATEQTTTEVGGVKVNDAYIGAELGGNFKTGSGHKDGETFNASNMVKAGAELGMGVTQGVEAFVGLEGRYAIEGVDEDWTNGKYNGDTTDLYRFTVGVDTVAGRTEFGKLEGVADEFDDFGDLSMEHGISAAYDNAKNGESTLQHRYTTEKFDVAASYDFETEAYVVGGTVVAVPNLTLGASYMDGGDAEDKAFNLGAVYTLDKLDLAAKYTNTEAKDADDFNSYALGAAYQVAPQIKVATTANLVEDGARDGDDDFFMTVGASYDLNKNVQFVTDYKVGSDNDDQLFVRANLNF